MAKKPKAQARKNASKATKTTSMRHSPIPRAMVKRPNGKVNGAGPKEITHQMIIERAYLISLSPSCGSQDENYFRAERELRDGI